MPFRIMPTKWWYLDKRLMSHLTWAIETKGAYFLHRSGRDGLGLLCIFFPNEGEWEVWEQSLA